MNQPKIRIYPDANTGLKRRVELHSESVAFLVPYNGKHSYVSEWKLEDGSLVRIPDDAWDHLLKVQETRPHNYHPVKPLPLES